MATSEMATTGSGDKLAKLTPSTVLSPKQMIGYLAAMVPQIRAALPASMKRNADRFARVLVTECSKNATLASCSAVSLMGSMMTSAQLGLEIGSALGQGYLVPYKNNKVGCYEAQLQIGYRGYCVLAHRSNLVQAFFAHVVRANDAFEFALGSQPFVKHVPCLKDPGEMVGCYAVMQTLAGGVDVEWMSREKILYYRDTFSKSYKGGGDSPWKSHEEEMSRKTVMRLLAKRSPVSLELATAAGLDDLASNDLPQNARYAFAEALPDYADLPPEVEGNKAEAVAGKFRPTAPAGPHDDVPR